MLYLVNHVLMDTSTISQQGEKKWSLNMSVLYPNPCYIKVCYKGTALFS